MPVEKGKIASADWELHINFNPDNKAAGLNERHFPGGRIDRELSVKVQKIDPGFTVQAGKPVFVDAVTRKTLSPGGP